MPGEHEGDAVGADDAAWILTCSFIIITMQTGFAMLESGCVSRKNSTNIMVKNMCDVAIGGIAYWSVGYALSFGKPSNWFCGYGSFFFTEKNATLAGGRMCHYFFQFSFASTATTIVSGAVAERMTLSSYMVFSFVNIVVYAIPVNWCWGEHGFLKHLGLYDFSGCTVVHLNGGMSALVASWMLGPRTGRFTNPEKFEMSSPSTAMVGMFMLMWSCLGYTAGSTMGVTQMRWKVSATVAVNTLNGIVSGASVGLLVSYLRTSKITVGVIITSTLGGMVSLAGVASVTDARYSCVIGATGAIFANAWAAALTRLKIDDPAGAIAVHCSAAIWGSVATGLFATENVVGSLNGIEGIISSGNFELLGVCLLATLVVGAWAALLTLVLLWLINRVIKIRMSMEAEMMGADFTEHGVRSSLTDSMISDIVGEIAICNMSIDELLRKIQSTNGHHWKPPNKENHKGNANGFPIRGLAIEGAGNSTPANGNSLRLEGSTHSQASGAPNGNQDTPKRTSTARFKSKTGPILAPLSKVA